MTASRGEGRWYQTAPWVLLAFLGLPGIAAGGYLTYSRLADQATVCAGIGQCELVQTSEYSAIAGVPVALLGVFYFAAVSLLALARLRRAPGTAEWAAPAAFSMALAATAFVAYLTYVELFVLEAICPWCVSLATLTVVSLLLTIWAALSPHDA